MINDEEFGVVFSDLPIQLPWLHSDPEVRRARLSRLAFELNTRCGRNDPLIDEVASLLQAMLAPQPASPGAEERYEAYFTSALSGTAAHYLACEPDKVVELAHAIAKAATGRTGK